MLVAWTTVSSPAEAEHLAQGAVLAGLAACAQVDAPGKSFYLWEGRLESAIEVRVWFKYLPANTSTLSAWVHRHHPYSIPQWIEVRAENVSEKYLSWAMANSTSAPFQSPKSP